MFAHPAIFRPLNTDLDESNGYGAKMSARNHSVPLAESQHHVINPTNPGSALDDGIEDRLHVRGRAADDAEHFSGCCLVFERLAQLCIALAEFFKQADVLDGDDRLSSKGLEQFDLLLRERLYLGSTKPNHAYRNPLSQ